MNVKCSCRNILVVGLHQQKNYFFIDLDIYSSAFARLDLYHSYLDLCKYTPKIDFRLFSSIDVDSISIFNTYLGGGRND